MCGGRRGRRGHPQARRGEDRARHPRSRASPGACECGIIYIVIEKLTEGAGGTDGACGAGLDDGEPSQACYSVGWKERGGQPMELSARCEVEAMETELECIAALHWRRRGG